MKHATSAAHRPRVRDAIVEEHPDSPLPPRRVALQALGAVMPVESPQTRLLPLLFAGLCLPISWLLVPDDAPLLRLVLASAMLAFAGAAAWTLRPRPSARAAARRVPEPALPQAFLRFVEDGIAASRRRGRIVALLRFDFALPDVAMREHRGLSEAIGESLRDVTRAYDCVHVGEDGTILVFIAHLPSDMQAQAVAARILDDLRLIGSPAAAASRIGLKAASLAEGEEMASLLARFAAEPSTVLAA